MFDFSEGNSLDHLDQDAREALVSLLEKRTAYFAHQTELNRLKIVALTTPTPEAWQAVTDYGTTYIKPLRESMTPEVMKLMERAVNVDAMKAMLPMLLAALAQSIDITLALTTLGADPDMVATVVGSAQEYFRGGL
jgi:hypothetical protein